MVFDLAASKFFERDIMNAKEALAALHAEKASYERIKIKLTTLPRQIRHAVMVPLGKRAFAPGYLQHTNEVLVHLGDRYYVQQVGVHRILSERSVSFATPAWLQ